MGKLILIAFVLVGIGFTINAMMPGLWTSGFQVAGHTIRWAYIAIGGVLYLAWTRIK